MERKTPIHDETIKYKSFDLDPAKTALVIVDMQNDWCKPGGHRYFSNVDSIIPKIKTLADTCRANGMKIIYVHSLRSLDSDEFVRFGQEPFIVRGTWGAEFTEELTPQATDFIVEKHTHDAFFKTGMDGLLEREAILPTTHDIIVTGLALNVCAYQAITGFHLRHYNVVLPMDCLGARPGVREGVERTFAGHAYNWNVHMSNLDMLKFKGRPVAA